MKFNLKRIQDLTTFMVFLSLFITYLFQFQTSRLTIFDHIIFLFILLLVGYLYYIRNNHIKEIEKTAYYDELTGLPNLVKFKKDAFAILKSNQNSEFAIVKVDIENFKVINEIFDFEIGNKVLKAFAKTADSVTLKPFFLARVGVDEFLMFGTRDFLMNLESLTEHYERFFKESVPEIENHLLAFRYGRYCIPTGETNVNDIVNKVVIAHKNSRSNSKTKINDYDENLKKQLLAKTSITNKMQKSLTNGEFKAYLQPKFSLQNNELSGAEALVRWIDTDSSVIYPNDFIPVFESNGFILKLDFFILETVCKTLRLWIDAGYKTYPISINFSRLHLNNPNLAFEIIDVLKKYNIPHNLIEVELTETAILDNEDHLLPKILDDFENNNIAVAVDDFGAGYSSLGLIKSVKPGIVKLDKSFLDNTSNQARSKLVIQGVVNLVSSLNATIVAEGVEDKEQAEFLKSINCDIAQGYFFAKPMPIREFEEKYLENQI